MYACNYEMGMIILILGNIGNSEVVVDSGWSAYLCSGM